MTASRADRRVSADAKAKAARAGGSMTWLLGVACGIAVTFATPSAVLGGVLLAPAILAAVLDGQPGRPVARVVFVAATGMIFMPLWRLNTGGATLALALDILSEPAVLCPAWLAAACGWALCEALPLALQAAADRQASHRMKSLREEAEIIKHDWDLEIE